MLFSNFIDLFLASAPWLLLGLALAGLIKEFVPMSWMEKQLGGQGVKSVIKAALLGAPLPLCSCGVIPTAIGLRRAGASKAATTSFLISTPETGIDSISVSYALLGPFMAIIRPIAAVFSAILAGVLVGRDESKSLVGSANKLQIRALSAVNAAEKSPFLLKPISHTAKNLTISPAAKMAASTSKPSCCEALAPQQSQNESCCSTAHSDAAPAVTLPKRFVHAFKYAVNDLIRDTSHWLLIGIFFAALVQTYVPVDFLAMWGDGILAMLVMVLVSVPMYICATASTPIAAGLLLAGISPGAVLVFMLAGPATNIATVGMVRAELGARALYAYLIGVIGGALLFGFLTNFLVEQFDIVVSAQMATQHEMLPHAFVVATGYILAILMARVVLGKFIKRLLNKKSCCS
ncbi:MAG: SO_0444 family Cu/Zn efflux transporter [Enterovibrio sp.]